MPQPLYILGRKACWHTYGMREWVSFRASLEKVLKRKIISSTGNQILAVQIITRRLWRRNFLAFALSISVVFSFFISVPTVWMNMIFWETCAKQKYSFWLRNAINSFTKITLIKKINYLSNTFKKNKHRISIRMGTKNRMWNIGL